MDEWKKDARRDVVFVDIDALVPEDHLLRKIEKVMDYDWLYKRLDPYYCHDNGWPGTDPVVLIKMVLLQHLYGIPSLRQTYQRIQDTLSYRWFLGYGLLDEIPHFATVSYAFCKRFPEELTEEIFAHILNKALNHRISGKNNLTLWSSSAKQIEGKKSTPCAKRRMNVSLPTQKKNMRCVTHHRGLARVTSWVRLKYAAMNLKKLAVWSWKNSFLRLFFSLFPPVYTEVPAFV